MSYDVGGRADKLGNRYEGRWVVKQLLRLLTEEVVSVTIEAIGDDEQGVDLWVVHKDGKRISQQCKGRNGNNDSWTIAKFKQKDILENIRFQLDRSVDIEFEFVSGAPFIELNDLCFSVRNSPCDPKLFYEIQSKVKSKIKFYKTLCDGLALDPTKESDQVKLYDYLRRLQVTLYPDDNNSWVDLNTQVSLIVSGGTESVIALLQDYAENTDNLGKPIFADQLWKYLEKQDHLPKNLSHDVQVLPTIKRLQTAFDDSIRPRLINGNIIQREEADQCLTKIEEGIGIIILHGAAGSGKSGVLFSIASKLKDEGTLYLPIRLDRLIPENTPVQFGRDMGLPDSPVNCLAVTAGDRKCVLILDQLDAIRWTSSHSSNALDVCKELVHKLCSFRRSGKNLSLIISCRTFDLSNDPEIKEWLNGNLGDKWLQIEVKPLPDEVVHKLVGESYDLLMPDQKGLLSNLQNLFMWFEIGYDKNLPPFRSAVALMRLFWKYKKAAIEKSITPQSIASVDSVIEGLTIWMTKMGKIAAPQIILSGCSPRAVEALESHGIILEQNGWVSFCHQTYLDYLVAEKLQREITEGGDILHWLGPMDKQSLFRREQLRQALVLLAEDTPDFFLTAVRKILDSSDVRFHIKHLALEVISSIDALSDENICNFILDRLQDPFWRKSILETVMQGNKSWTSMLIGKGLLDDWLRGPIQDHCDDAVGILRSVSTILPDAVARILDPLVNQGENWPEKAFRAIEWHITEDSEALFTLRMKLIDLGFLPPFIDWPQIAKSSPLRSVQLAAALLNSLPEDVEAVHRRNHSEQWYDHDIEPLMQAAETCPIETWQQLVPIIQKMTITWPESPYDPQATRWQKDRLERSATTLERGTVELLIKAGQTLAKQNSELFLSMTENLENDPSPVIQEILIETYAMLEPSYADNGIRWLLGDLKRLQLGDGATEVEWAPAMRLVEALSPNCSLSVFNDLEYALSHYHEPDELREAQNSLESWRQYKVLNNYWWGRAQYHILPKLPSSRCKSTTIALIAVLERKFADYAKHRFLRCSHGVGGFVGSPLQKNITQLSDRTWLKIVTNKAIPKEGGWNWKQVSEDHITETSLLQFSRSLGSIAISFPERFGRLSLQFPADSDPYYVSAIFRALSFTAVKDEVLPEFRNDWKPASFETVLAVVHRFKHYLKNEVAREFCKLVEERAEEEWPDFMFDMVQDLAMDSKNSTVVSESESVNQIETSTLNCVRGIACNAMTALLWKCYGLFPRFKQTIEFLSHENDPVALMALTRMLYPVLNIDKEQATTWFFCAADKDYRTIPSHLGLMFVNATVKEYHVLYIHLFHKMLKSPSVEIQKISAHMVSAYNLFHGHFQEEVEYCLSGSMAHRQGVAQTAVGNIATLKYAAKCREYIAKLMNDPDKEVRAMLSGMFHEPLFDIPENIDFTVEYVKSASFAQESFAIFHALQERKESLLPFAYIILETCAAAVKVHLGASEDKYSRVGQIMHGLPPLLLRLYEQAQENDLVIASRCLDAWDLFFQHGLGQTRYLTKDFEQ